MRKNLIVCPICYENGTKQVLGELDENGNFVVMRFKGQGHNASTVIFSPLMLVKCGVCNSTVFYRKET